MVTGGNGFLGFYVVKELEKKGCKYIFAPTVDDFDLTKKENIERAYDQFSPHIVIHLAAAVGGIGANNDYPGSFFYKNLIMGIELMEQARLKNIEKFISVGTICCYPKITPVPFSEDDLWNGYPDEITGFYGLAKKMLLVQSNAYRKEYNFNSIFLMPTNLYGPQDNFIEKNAHVIPAIIKRVLDAKNTKRDSIECWGTGESTREFLHARDCARGIILAAENYNKSEPVNLGTGIETKINDLTQLIVDICDYKGQIRWDKSKPEGQPRRCLNVERAKKFFGFEYEIELPQGLAETIEWYVQHGRGKG